MQERFDGGVEAVEGRESAVFKRPSGSKNLVQRCDFRAQKEWKKDRN